eukprot:PLAT5943.1.p1 GENE.PLAT5943.1~~PLAT5943.1.p1  ORF type:complete len:304 (+),score=81.42 PLAT5943.1:65-976(+)
MLRPAALFTAPAGIVALRKQVARMQRNALRLLQDNKRLRAKLAAARARAAWMQRLHDAATSEHGPRAEQSLAALRADYLALACRAEAACAGNALLLRLLWSLSAEQGNAVLLMRREEMDVDELLAMLADIIKTESEAGKDGADDSERPVETLQSACGVLRNLLVDGDCAAAVLEHEALFPRLLAASTTATGATRPAACTPVLLAMQNMASHSEGALALVEAGAQAVLVRFLGNAARSAASGRKSALHTLRLLAMHTGFHGLLSLGDTALFSLFRSLLRDSDSAISAMARQLYNDLKAAGSGKV